jgi:hypothetical protein
MKDEEALRAKSSDWEFLTIDQTEVGASLPSYMRVEKIKFPKRCDLFGMDAETR